jgi:Asp/Glu/hydantoin racemase
MKIPVSFLHTSPAAIGPLMQHCGEHAPDLEITNQLDDGLLRLLAAGRADVVEQRLREMLRAAREVYGAKLAMVTCSSVTPAIIAALRPEAGIPLFKIDDPMAAGAVAAGSRIGVVMTFPPTQAPTSRLLSSAAEAAGKQVELVPLLVPEAYQALLAGRAEEHDELLIPRVVDLAEEVEAIVLAQVSLARLLPKLEGRTGGVPVFSSLTASLAKIREILG